MTSSIKLAGGLWILFVVMTLVFAYQPRGIFFSSLAGLLFAFVCFCIFFRQEQIRIMIPYSVISIAILIIIALLNINNVWDFGHYYEKLGRLVNLLIVLFFGMNLIREVDLKYPFRIWNWTISVYIMVMSIQACFVYFDVIIHRDLSRATGFFNNPNSFGVTNAIGVLLLLNRWFETKRWGIFLLIAWLGGNVILSASRQALIGMFVAIFVYLFVVFLISKPMERRRIIITIIGGTVPLLGVLWLMQQNGLYSDRLNNIFIPKSDSANVAEHNGTNSLNHRSQFYTKGIEMWGDYPIFGVGADQFRAYSAEYGVTETGKYSHSNYIELLSTFGSVGFLVYIFNYLGLAGVLIYRRKDIIRFSSISFYATAVTYLCFLIVVDFARITYYGPVEWLVLMVLLAEMAVINRRIQEESPSAESRRLPIGNRGLWKGRASV